MAKGSGMIHPNMATMLGVCVVMIYLFFYKFGINDHFSV